MTFDEFERYQDALLESVKNMAKTKGKEYANGEDRFGNFNRLSERLGIKNTQIGWIYLVKHLDAIEQFMRTDKTHSEERIEGRIIDAITYLTLIGGMLKEAEGDKTDEPIDDKSPLRRNARPAPLEDQIPPFGSIARTK